MKHPLTEEQSKLRSSQVLWHTDRKTYRDIQTSKWTKNYVIRYLISLRPRHKTYMILENLCTCTGYIKTHQNSCNLWGVSRFLSILIINELYLFFLMVHIKNNKNVFNLINLPPYGVMGNRWVVPLWELTVTHLLSWLKHMSITCQKEDYKVRCQSMQS